MATSSAVPVDPQAAEKTAVLAAYAALTAVEERSYARARVDPESARYVTDKALADIQATVFWYRQGKTTVQGTVRRAPKVTTLDTASKPLRASVADCADSTGQRGVETATGGEVSYSGPGRHVVTSTVIRPAGGAWRFLACVIERDRAC
ncbi:hypothetical protein OG321_39865 [Streptomyces sp. NBC_00424]|uniref:hypothetical protein n=1 Tax=Streptomyces sp. NBC_00424 TaxID=2903648 RepID=UPI002259D9BC|nr:hypothetical protein [Streptomyces sp. NBC_00424]MCX5078578.1 hypothetical protein [Streptomyces sp. NBC_00424]